MLSNNKFYIGNQNLLVFITAESYVDLNHKKFFDEKIYFVLHKTSSKSSVPQNQLIERVHYNKLLNSSFEYRMYDCIK